MLLQGVVDAWFETKDGLVIVDYKTDRIRPEGVPARTAYYARSCAPLRRGHGAHHRPPVCRRVLYFLHCGQISEVPGRTHKKITKTLAFLSPACYNSGCVL